jgi:hypothetical protein
MNKTHSLLFLFLIFTATSVFAVGLGVNPAYLNFDISSLEDFEKEIYVINNESISYDFSLYSDSEAVKAIPEQLSLGGGENQKVVVRLDPKKVGSSFEATLFIVSSDPGKPEVRAGIKMPIKIEILNQNVLEKAIENADTEKTTEEETSQGIGPTGLFSLVGGQELLGILIIALIAIAALVLFKRRQRIKTEKE